MNTQEILTVVRSAHQRIAESRWQDPSPVAAIMAKIPSGSWREGTIHTCPECGSASFSAQALPIADNGLRPWLLTCHHGHEWMHSPQRKIA